MEWLMLLLVLAAVVVVAAVLVTRQRTASLRGRFGTEYDRAVAEQGDRRRAEAGLRAVAKRRAAVEVSPLPPESQRRYRERWRDAQGRFVDAPARALAEADALVGQVMRERGYPTGDFDEQAAMVAADHGDRADNYRRAYAVHRGVTAVTVSTDELRQAFLNYREVFQALVAEAAKGDEDAPPAGRGGPTTTPVPEPPEAPAPAAPPAPAAGSPAAGSPAPARPAAADRAGPEDDGEAPRPRPSPEPGARPADPAAR